MFYLKYKNNYITKIKTKQHSIKIHYENRDILRKTLQPLNQTPQETEHCSGSVLSSLYKK
jgi:hypothetical protein